jgi:hypothetical protein
MKILVIVVACMGTLPPHIINSVAAEQLPSEVRSARESDHVYSPEFDTFEHNWADVYPETKEEQIQRAEFLNEAGNWVTFFQWKLLPIGVLCYLAIGIIFMLRWMVTTMSET